MTDAHSGLINHTVLDGLPAPTGPTVDTRSYTDHCNALNRDRSTYLNETVCVGTVSRQLCVRLTRNYSCTMVYSDAHADFAVSLSGRPSRVRGHARRESECEYRIAQ